MDSTAGTEPAATSEQPARSPAKARKYNFGRPGGPRKSRRSSTRRAPPRRANSVVANDRPSPRLRPATSRCRCCGCGRPAAVAAANLRDCALALQASSHHVVGPSGRSPLVLTACCCCCPCALTALSCCALILGFQMPLLVLDPGVQVGFSAREDGFSLRLGSLGDGFLVTAVLEEPGEAPELACNVGRASIAGESQSSTKTPPNPPHQTLIWRK